MDPATAGLNLAAAITNLITEVLKDGTPEQKQKLLSFYIEDAEFWRGLFKSLLKIEAKP